MIFWLIRFVDNCTYFNKNGSKNTLMLHIHEEIQNPFLDRIMFSMKYPDIRVSKRTVEVKPNWELLWNSYNNFRHITYQNIWNSPLYMMVLESCGSVDVWFFNLFHIKNIFRLDNLIFDAPCILKSNCALVSQ